jgi:hypothetical protein
MFDERALEGLDLEPIGSSPDGLGLAPAAQQLVPQQQSVPQQPTVQYYQAPVEAMPQYQTRRGVPGYPPGPMRPVAGQTFNWLEPDNSSQSAVMRSAGISALFLAASFGVGVALGGPWGAAAGVLLAGTAMNTYRAQKWWGSQDPSQNYEATSSAVFAVGGLALGGYAAYKAYLTKTSK